MDKPLLTDIFDPLPQRRAHERRPLHAPAKLMLTGKRIVEVRALNLSAGGVALIAPENLPVGTACEIRFDLPTKPAGKLTLYVEAMVMNTVFSSREDGFKIGLKFTHLTPEHVTRIAVFVNG